MNRLVKYIHKLLQVQDYVIVPDFGGFVVQYESAEYVAKDQIFLPPYKTLSFNPRLMMNDGLLAQVYMEGEEVDYAAAQQRLAYDVEQVKKKLQSEGVCVLESIGSLKRQSEGVYMFEPTVATLSSPQLYGLDGFSIVSNIDSKGICLSKAVVDETEEGEEEKKNSYTFRLSRKWVNNGVAAVLAILVYFMWATPVNKESTASQAAFLQNQLFETFKTKPEEVVEVEKATEKEQRIDVEAEQKVEKIDRPIRYTIVLASCITKKNADAFVDYIKREGFPDAEVARTHQVRRVIYGGYSTMEEVHSVLEELHKHKDFKDAWVLRLK